MKTRDRDAKFLGRDSDPEDIEVVRSKGSVVVGANRRKYVDFLMGWCVGNVGWGNEEIRDAIRRYDGPEYVAPKYLYRRWAELAEMLVGLAPGKLRKVFRATGGTEAVEMALQAAMVHTGRHGFVSIEGAYHGNSIAAKSVGSSEYREVFENLLPNCRKLAPPLDRRAADRLRTLLQGKDVAGFILEPVVCNLGVLVPSREFMTRAQALCRKYGTVFILDEVATGFGRTGRMFAAEHFGLEPDVMCVAKGLSGGYGPLGATLMTDAVARSMREEDSFYSTYGWHPLSVEAAIANVRYLKRHRTALERNVDRMSDYFVERLTTMGFPHAITVSAKGLAIGVRFEKEGYVYGLVDRARENGVLVSAMNERTLVLFPALTIDESSAKLGLDRLAKSV